MKNYSSFGFILILIPLNMGIACKAKKSNVNNLVAIEREINLEKNKLEQLVSKRNSEKIIDAPTNDEEMQNVFG